MSSPPLGILKTAIAEQNTIRWNNFYRGRITRKWEKVQHQYLKQIQSANTDTNRWASSLISTMWHGFLLLWEDRNSNQHGRNSIEQNTIKQESLLKKIRKLYEEKETLEHEDQRIYNKPVEEWEQETNRKIRQWINLTKPLTKKSK
jgi:hypothetical protein